MALSIENAAKAKYVCATADAVFVDHGAGVEVVATADGIEIKGDKAAWAAIVSAVAAIYDGIEG